MWLLRNVKLSHKLVFQDVLHRGLLSYFRGFTIHLVLWGLIRLTSERGMLHSNPNTGRSWASDFCCNLFVLFSVVYIINRSLRRFKRLCSFKCCFDSLAISEMVCFSVNVSLIIRNLTARKFRLAKRILLKYHV